MAFLEVQGVSYIDITYSLVQVRGYTGVVLGVKTRVGQGEGTKALREIGAQKIT